MLPAIEQDLIIIGAGASGLLLLVALHESKYPGRVTILEQQLTPSDNRIWSFWLDESLPSYLHNIIDHKWSSWRFSSSLTTRKMFDAKQPYCSIRARSLTALAQSIIEDSEQYSILYDCNVALINTSERLTTISTSRGEYSAPNVIDTRTPPLHKNHLGLFQCFYGIEVETDQDVFDIDCVELMQDLQQTVQGLEFVYTLPFSARHALIELTYFSAKPISIKSLELPLQRRVKTLLEARRFSIVRNEGGVLPMYAIDLNQQSPKPDSLVYAGIAGGSLRASTGYSFQNSQRWAQAQAKHLVEHKSLMFSQPIKPIYHMLDQWFLRVLRNSPEISVTLYSRLFEKLKPSTLVHFMSERASWYEIFQVINSMPKWQFMCALLKSIKPINRSAGGK